MEQPARAVEIVVIADVHLGTLGCHARELARYLSQIRPRILILNGDIIDIWQFRKRYFPASHTRVIRRILEMTGEGTTVYYLTGNHDEALRKYAGFSLPNLNIDNKLVLEIDGRTHWFFHGDVFDVTMKKSKWLAKLGGQGYDLLILINRLVNVLLEKMGREKMSFSKRVKNSVKQAVMFISGFESLVSSIAADQGYDIVCCGHIHHPCIREIYSEGKSVLYLNAGDWVENLTALEYDAGKWSLYQHPLKDTGDEDHLDESGSKTKTGLIPV
ncbi:MAG TPA: UDP-2,3-diacylglucosamine diphosphatase [Chitinophagaceae bacterium]|nr:UDP-2,3-diacylglucosamine diphosphatase [Chitinophagaceae bacterium]